MTSGSVKSSFNCPKCGKRWTWKPPLAGKKVKCRCGAVFAVPAKPPAPSAAPRPPAPAKPPASANPALLAPITASIAPPDQEDSLYDLAPGVEKIEPPPKPLPVAQEAPAAAPPKKAIARILNYGGNPGLAAAAKPAAQRADIGDIWEGNKVKNLIVPISLVVAACALNVCVNLFFSQNASRSMAIAAIDMGVRVGVDVPVMLLACFIAAKLLDVSFGPVGPAILKLCSIAVAPEGIMSLFLLAGILLGGAHGSGALLGGLYGLLIGWAASLFLYWWLFYYYFDLQFTEILKTVLIAWGLRIVGAIFLVSFLLALLK